MDDNDNVNCGCDIRDAFGCISNGIPSSESIAAPNLSPSAVPNADPNAAPS